MTTVSARFLLFFFEMKHNGFEIKIADLLKTKATDTLSFENKMLPELPNLTAEGVS